MVVVDWFYVTQFIYVGVITTHYTLHRRPAEGEWFFLHFKRQRPYIPHCVLGAHQTYQLIITLYWRLVSQSLHERHRQTSGILYVTLMLDQNALIKQEM